MIIGMIIVIIKKEVSCIWLIKINFRVYISFLFILFLLLLLGVLFTKFIENIPIFVHSEIIQNLLFGIK